MVPTPEKKQETAMDKEIIPKQEKSKSRVTRGDNTLEKNKARRWKEPGSLAGLGSRSARLSPKRNELVQPLYFSVSVDD